MEQSANELPRSSTLTSSAWEIVKFVLTVLLIVLPIRAWIAKPFIVSGDSMKPTFHDKEYLIVDEISYRLRPPRRGEIIVFKNPNRPSEYFIKRIIGLPGETVKVRGNQVFIEKDGQSQKIEEPYPNLDNTGKDNTILTLAEGQYFVMGDNRGVSMDSRIWGALEENLITGRVFLRLYPLERINLLPGEFRASQ